MKFSMLHNNINVFDLDRSMKFYAEALGLFEVGRIAPETGDFIIVYLGDGTSGHKLELTWLRDREEPYDLGEMGCVAFINEDMGIYFITDPDGYWLEILPPGRG